MKENITNCALCPVKVSDRACKKKSGNYPENCPTEKKKALLESAVKEYEKSEVYHFGHWFSLIGH